VFRERGIGGDGDYCGDNDAQLDRISVPPRGALRPERASPLGDLFRPCDPVNQNAGAGNN
jgi:hypothetical protein